MRRGTWNLSAIGAKTFGKMRHLLRVTLIRGRGTGKADRNELPNCFASSDNLRNVCTHRSLECP